jgi:hypothetical protein
MLPNHDSSDLTSSDDGLQDQPGLTGTMYDSVKDDPVKLTGTMYDPEASLLQAEQLPSGSLVSGSLVHGTFNAIS